MSFNIPVSSSKQILNLLRHIFKELIVIAILLVGLISFIPIATPEQSASIYGVHFSQVDFMFPNSGPMSALAIDSDWGRVEVDVSEFTSSQNLSEGFLNLYTDSGWVVQNQLIDQVDGMDNITFYFDLGVSVGTDITSLSAYLEFTSEPLGNFTDGPREIFPVYAAKYDAQGIGPMTYIPIPLALPPDLIFDPFGQTFSFSKPNVAGENVQAASMQCVPMAIANSLQYLENRYWCFSVPHDHDVGLNGDNSLVGQLDAACNRWAPSRTTGSGVWFDDMLEGKFKYLSDNGLSNRLVHKHQGYGYGTGALPVGDFTKHGITSKDESVNGQVTFDWILEQLQGCEDVEVVIQYEDGFGNPTGGHALRVFGAGKTGGVPWLRYKHDRLQTGSDPTDTQGLEEVQVEVRDLDGDGMMNFGSNTIEICFALAESPRLLVIMTPIPRKPIFYSGYGLSLNTTIFNCGNISRDFNVVIAEPIFNSTQIEIFWSMGDVNKDGFIDDLDLDIIQDNWGWIGPLGENPADINGDGAVDIYDLAIASANYGRDIWTWFALSPVPIGKQAVTLSGQTSTTLTFTKNITDEDLGNHTIYAYITFYNYAMDGSIFITIPGDINGDKWVNAKDAIALGVAFYPFGEYDPKVDINDDSYCNAKDAIILGTHFNQHW